jgi:SAM-dependent methyltransferase
VEHHEYERLAAVEERGWWFRGLHANLLAAWRRAAPISVNPVVLDAGCGTGGLLVRLGAALPQARRFGIDLDPLAGSLARGKSNALIAVGSTMALPFAAERLDAVFSVDVLCHKGVAPRAALQSILWCLRPGGTIILNLPAYRWLFSGHDRAVDNVRRFGRGEIETLLAEEGFTQIRTRYWNSALFPLMLLQRLTHRHGASDVALLPAPIERLFHAIVVAEAWLADRGWRFPFGGSILATAVRP